jgi:hypothetical protein
MLIVVSRSPNSTEENNSKLLNILSNLPYNSHTALIVGDFNMPKINWETWSTPTSAESKEHKLIESLRDNFLILLVWKPTRFHGSDIPSILDLVVTNKEEVVKSIDYQSGIGKSDHCVLEINIECTIPDSSRSKEYRNYNKGNYTQC